MSTQQAAIPSTGEEQQHAMRPGVLGTQTAPGDTSVRLRGRWLVAARIVWVLVALFSAGMFIAAIPATFEQLYDLRFILDAPSRSMVQQGFTQLGISADFFANFYLWAAIIRTLVFFLVAVVIFARRSDDLMAYFVSIFLLTFSVGRMVQVLLVSKDWGIPASLLVTIAYSSFVLFYYIFPNGRFVPEWTRQLSIVWVVIITLAFFFPDSPADLRTYLPFGTAIITTSLLALGAFAQIYRYRRASNPLEKQQIKWVTYGAAIILAINVGYIIPTLFDPSLGLNGPPADRGVLYLMLGNACVTIQLLIIPISLGITILRYRLWNIDLIINRTLVYIPLTGIVAGLYSASVALFQKLFQTFTGEKSDSAIIISTLILAALFTPLKNGLQSLVDKRFKEAPDPTRSIRGLGKEVARSIYALDTGAVTRRFFEEATAGFGTGGALYLEPVASSVPRLTYATEGWQDSQAQVTVSLQAADKEIGRLLLGRLPEGRTYREKDREALEEVARQIAAAIHP